MPFKCFIFIFLYNTEKETAFYEALTQMYVKFLLGACTLKKYIGFFMSCILLKYTLWTCKTEKYTVLIMIQKQFPNENIDCYYSIINSKQKIHHAFKKASMGSIPSIFIRWASINLFRCTGKYDTFIMTSSLSVFQFIHRLWKEV